MPQLKCGRVVLLQRAVLGVFACVGATSCLTQAEGEALQKDIKRLRQEMLVERENTAAAQERLKAVLEQAAALTTRNSADVGVQVEQLQLEVSKLAGRIETLGQALETLRGELGELKARPEPAAGGTPGGLPPAAEVSPEDLYRAGVAKVQASDHEQGRTLLRQFIARFPADARAASAQLALGNSYYAQQKLAPAIQEFRKVVEQHKGSAAVPEALYKIGMSFYQLKYCSDAKNFFEELLRTYRQSTYAPQTRRALQRIRQYRKNRRICTS